MLVALALYFDRTRRYPRRIRRNAERQSNADQSNLRSAGAAVEGLSDPFSDRRRHR